MNENPQATFKAMARALAAKRQTEWANLGGQLVRADDLAKLKSGIKTGKLDSWQAVHDAYDRLWEKYPRDKQRHALATLLALLGAKDLTAKAWAAALDEAVRIQEYVADQTYITRKKDFDSPFRRMVYSTPAEMAAVLGTPEDNSFVKQVRKETAAFAALVESIKARG